MHSSRMRTGRSLTVCQSLLTRGVCASWGCVYVSKGDACFWGVVSQHALRQTPPVNRITDITLATTSLQVVINGKRMHSFSKNCHSCLFLMAQRVIGLRLLFCFKIEEFFLHCMQRTSQKWNK